MKMLAAVAVRGVIGDAVARFTGISGQPVTVEFALNPAVAQRLLAGEIFDVATTNPGYVGTLVAAGRVDAGAARPLGRIPLAVGGPQGRVFAGDLSDLLRGAGRIAYTGEGTSGQAFLSQLSVLGLDSLAARTVPMGAGQPVQAVAAGTADLAIAPLTVLLATEGVVPLAQFPAAPGADIAMSVFPTRAAGDPALARRLTDFLAGPELDDLFIAGGVLRE